VQAIFRRQCDPVSADERRKQHEPIHRIDANGSPEDEFQRVGPGNGRARNDEPGDDEEDIDAACEDCERAFGDAGAHHIGASGNRVSADDGQRGQTAHGLHTPEYLQNRPRHPDFCRCNLGTKH